MVTVVNEFVPETVRYFRVTGMGGMQRKVVVLPPTNSQVGFYTQGSVGGEKVYTGTLPTLLETSYSNTWINYSTTGFTQDGLNNPAYIYFGRDYPSQNRVFTIADESVVPGAIGFSFNPGQFLVDANQVAVFELLNADQRVIGRHIFTPSDAESQVIDIVIDNFYLHSSPEQRGMNVTTVTLADTIDDPSGLFTSNCAAVNSECADIWKVVVPPNTAANVKSFIPNATTLNQSGIFVLYDQTGVNLGLISPNTEVPYVNTLPISTVEKTYYLFLSGGVFNSSGTTFYDDFIVYHYGQTQDPVIGAFQKTPVISLTPGDSGYLGDYVMDSVDLIPNSPSIAWGSFEVADSGKQYVLSTISDYEFADTVLFVFDSQGQLVDVNYDSPTSMHAELTFGGWDPGTYYFAVSLYDAGTTNQLHQFNVYNIHAEPLSSEIRLSFSEIVDPNIYIDGSVNGCTIACLPGTKTVLKDSPAHPFDRTFRCRLFSFDSGKCEVGATKGFRRRVPKNQWDTDGTLQDVIDPAFITFSNAGDWVDVVYDDQAQAFQIVGRGSDAANTYWSGGLATWGTSRAIEPETSVTAKYLPNFWENQNLTTLYGDLLSYNDNIFSRTENGNRIFTAAPASAFKVTITAKVTVGPNITIPPGGTSISLILQGSYDTRTVLVVDVPAIQTLMEAETINLTVSSTGIVHSEPGDVWTVSYQSQHISPDWDTISIGDLQIMIQKYSQPERFVENNNAQPPLA